MAKRDIVVIGASAGGFEALKHIVSRLPGDLPASVFVVWHMAPDIRGLLPEVLNRVGTLSAAHAVDDETITAGRIYVAPPDHHMLLVNGKLRLSKGPKENRFRPAIDPLFRSAALAYGARVIGVILSGALDDGTAGLWIVKEFGGLTVVQYPADAEVPSMPESAIQAVRVDHVARIGEMAALLTKLVSAPVPESLTPPGDQKRTEEEIKIAMEQNPLEHNVREFGDLTPYTCPECHGVLTAFREGGRLRFRCHTGHGFSADTLLAAITETVEESMWSAVRNIQESVIFLNHMGDHFSEVNQPKLAAMYFRKAKEAEKRGTMIRHAISSHEQLSQEKMKVETDKGNGKKG